MTDLISRQAAIEALKIDCSWDIFDEYGNITERGQNIIETISRVPSAQSERKKGKWTEKEVMNIEDSKAIEQWQSCCCSECGRYNTEPYLYYFNKPNFCPYCGADMREK